MAGLWRGSQGSWSAEFHTTLELQAVNIQGVSHWLEILNPSQGWQGKGGRCRAENSDLKLDCRAQGLNQPHSFDGGEWFWAGAARWCTHVLAVTTADGMTRADRRALGASYRCTVDAEKLTPCSLQVLASEDTHTHTHTRLQCKLICASFSVQNQWLREIWYQYISAHPFPSAVFKGGHLLRPHGLSVKQPDGDKSVWSLIDFTV